MLGEREGASRPACAEGRSGHPGWTSGWPWGLGQPDAGPRVVSRHEESTVRVRHCGRLSGRPHLPKPPKQGHQPLPQGQIAEAGGGDGVEQSWGPA